MATLAFTVAGKVVGTALGGPIGGALGSVVGSAIGGAIDARLFPPAKRQVEGPRAASTAVSLAPEGEVTGYVQGWARVQAKPIWSTRLKEVASTSTQGGKGAPSAPETETTTYRYLATVALSLAIRLDGADAAVAHVGRAWADRKPLDLEALGARIYYGTADQDPDPTLEAVEGAGNAPAYRNRAYILLENWDVTDYGARLPVVHVEICRPIGRMETLVEAVNIAPGATEWGYATTRIRKTRGEGSGAKENGWRSEAEADFSVSLRQLRQTLPRVKSASLVVAWMGTSLDAATCLVRPEVEIADKVTAPLSWAAGGFTRDTAAVVSQVAGRPAYGSAPADVSVVEAIQALKEEGLAVTVYPFLLMDAPGFPWRGRIAPASDGTAQARLDVEAFFDRWRAFVLHLAGLAEDAGGVETMLLGGELRGLTRARDDAGLYPGVERLVALRGEVAAGSASSLIGYAADWTEYHSHRPDDGSGDVIFNLDPLHAVTDFVGIDAYFPLADWRGTADELDRDEAAGVNSPYVLDYLKANVEGGEGFDWFYASDADRAAQTRTPISDSAHGEDWVFRQKGLRDWWANPHHDRPGGVRSATPTAWVPKSKPIRFTEYGCPAIDKGANQPNVFVDPKSSESFAPYYSTGARDDFMQRQYIVAWNEHWTETNETSPGGVDLIDLDRMHLWVWDARPWPEFPTNEGQWGDGPNYRLGHWINGRAGGAPAAEAIAELVDHYAPGTPVDVSRAWGVVDGWASDQALTGRGALQPWEAALRIDAWEAFGTLTFQSRAAMTSWGVVSEADLVDRDSLFVLERSDVVDPPRRAVVTFSDSYADWQQGLAADEIETGVELGDAGADLPFGLSVDRARPMATQWLRDVAESRETWAAELPPSAADLTPGRLIGVEIGGEARPFLVEKVETGFARRVTARSFDQGALAPGLAGPSRPAPAVVSAEPEAPALAFLDLPMLRPDANPAAGYLAAYGDPWLGAAVYRAPESGGPWGLNVTIGAPSVMGALALDLDPATATDAWVGQTARVALLSGAPQTLTRAEVEAGANTMAVEAAAGWEVFSFRRAALVSAGVYDLSELIRGRRGTEAAAEAGALAGARMVLLSTPLAQADMSAADIGAPLWWRYGPAGRDIGGDLYATEQHAFAGVGLRPFRPDGLRGSADGLGGVDLSWRRRARLPGVALHTPPLAEDLERYRVRIFAAGGGAAVREAETTAPAFAYTAAMRAADALGSRLEARVAQWSATVGWGAEASALVAV